MVNFGPFYKLKVECRGLAKVALITGITGQDGAFLAEYLLEKGYEVHGIKRRSSSFNTDRIEHLYIDRHKHNAKLFLHYGDMTDSTGLIRIIQECQPDEIYNLAAMSHVHISFEQPEYVADVDGTGTLRILEAVRLLGLTKKTRIYQASTSELYGKVVETPQNENTPFHPRSPYAVAKMYAYWITRNYREAYGMFASNGILFNHESSIRGETFVTRKITRSVAQIVFGFESKLYLGNLDAKRDWGHARDYVRSMHLILQHDQPDDFVVATGRAYSVRNFVERAFDEVGVKIEFEGLGVSEVGRVAEIDSEQFLRKTGIEAHYLTVGQVVVEVLAEYFRPAEVDSLLGDASKIRETLGWEPTMGFSEIVRDMVNSDISSFYKAYVMKQHQQGNILAKPKDMNE